jgi:ABC-type antimicrobial peptide transport system permease subunit
VWVFVIITAITTLKENIMFWHNLLFFYRRALRSKGSFFINLIGLSTGLACTLLIYLWIHDELSVDKFHKNDRQLYHVMQNLQFSNTIQTLEQTPSPLAEALVKEIPEVERAVAVNQSTTGDFKGEGVISYENDHIKVRGIFASKDYFNVFSYELIEGNKERVLMDKNGIVISESLAKKLFKDTDHILGKTIEWTHKMPLEGPFHVTGVFKDSPLNSTSQFDVVFNFKKLLEADLYANQWNGSYAETYVLIKKGTDLTHFNHKIAHFLKSKDSSNEKNTLFAVKYSTKYLYGRFENGVQTGGRIEYVKMFSILALFIVLIACINFMNLSTAKASEKMKEIGVKKVIGASRKALVVEFLIETFLMVFLSLIVAIGLTVLLLPQFNEITGKHLQFTFDTHIILPLIVIVSFTGLIAGSYPAFYLSSFKPIVVLKGKLDTAIGDLLMRKGLVIVQFTISIIFIVGFLVINKQVQYTLTKNLGYNRDNIIKFEKQGVDTDGSYQAFQSELKKIPGVVNISSMAGSFLKNVGIRTGFSWGGENTNEEEMSFQNLRVSYDFVETLGIQLKEGRSFSPSYTKEDSKIILNEEAIKVMGLLEPVGKTIKYGKEDMQIIGVVKNFFYGSLHDPLKPLIIMYTPYTRDMLVKIKAGTEKKTIHQVKEVYETFYPKLPFEFTFMDQDYQALYASELHLGILSQYFAFLAIVISCIGLFGLMAFTAQRRRKEIGVRKVLGAQVWQIVLLLSKDFLILVLLAMCIGFPMALWATSSWLQGFAYQAPISLWLYILAAFVVIVIALLTVSSQAIRAALANPVKSLRNE